MRSFSAIGDTTNLAVRLQTFAEEGSVVVEASTYALIDDWAIVRPLGSPELKGRSRPVEVYELTVGVAVARVIGKSSPVSIMGAAPRGSA